jgi:uncharacterized protein YicC (UPF0701 family)
VIKSMTAYGRGEHLQGNTRFVAEVRSLNNRYRDIIIRIPKNFQALEEDFRSLVASGVRRGRVEVVLQKENGADETPYDLELNVPLVKAYLEVFDRLSEMTGLPREVAMESLCRTNDVIVVKPREMAIEADFTQRLELLERCAGQVKDRSPEVVASFRDRLREKVGRMLQEDVAVDESRLAQEVAFMAERSDVTEELVRLDSHMVQFREFLAVDDAVGRRLEFLIQEMNREVNTLGAKASDPFISRIVVEMKAELEKLREQVQNVE